MIESFVDLTYRGLSLGRRIKLSHVRPSTGYLETPAPMPVGTPLSIATDEGLTLQATVTAVHEQTGGSEIVPGMTVAPALAGEAIESWWRARVAYPDETKAAPAVARTSSKVTVRPRSHTIPESPPEGVMAAAAADPEPAGGKTIAMTAVPDPSAITEVIPVLPDSKATSVMPAIDQELLESLTRGSGEIEKLVRRTGEHAVVDDGKQTMVMDAVDPAALGLDTGSSGTFGAVDEDSGASPDDKKGGGNGKKKRKRR
jgi:hypothetical protein